MKRTLIVIFSLIALLALVKIFFLTDSSEKKQAGGQAFSAAPLAVSVYVAQAEKIESKLFVSGTVKANEEAELVAEMPGRIVTLNVREGKLAAKGELLVKVNDADLQAQLKKLKAQEELVNQRKSRQEKLLAISGISKEEYEITLNELSAIRADMEFTQAQIMKTEIRAPFAGTVGLKNVSEGSVVSSSLVIASIFQTDPVKIDFSVPERYASLVKEGNSICFSVEGNPVPLEAKISAIEPKIDIATRSVNVRAISPNRQNKIFPGSFARVEIILKETENSILLPSEALIPVLKGYKVYVSRNGKAEEVKVLTGLRTENRVQILEGLQPGDTVITSGIMQLKPGSTVKIESVK